MSAALPLISVVVPSFNQGQFLRQTLESIFQQGYPHLEVIVMDGGSVDESVSIIRSYAPRLKHWQSQADDGQSAAINDGMKHCRGEVVAWLNSDDWYCRDALWLVGRAYVQHPGCGLYIGNGYRYRDPEGRQIPFCARHMALGRHALVQGMDYILQPATFFARRAWEEVDGLNPSLHYCMDWDVILRIAERYPAVMINEFLAVSREYEETKTSRGKLARIWELMRMVQSHSDSMLTPGTLAYLLDTLRQAVDHPQYQEVRDTFDRTLEGLSRQFQRHGLDDNTAPEQGDAQDRTYIPVADADAPGRPECPEAGSLPAIRVVVPIQHALLEDALVSIRAQQYPRSEIILPNRGEVSSAHAILPVPTDAEQAGSDIVAWMSKDAILAQDALWKVGQAFAEDAALDFVMGRALRVDHQGTAHSVSDGEEALDALLHYWRYETSLPVVAFVRRRVLDRQSIGAGVDVRDLVHQVTGGVKIRHLDRVLVLHYPQEGDQQADRRMQYRWSRARWGVWGSSEFLQTWKEFVKCSVKRGFGPRRGARFWSTACVVAASALCGIGNAEMIGAWLAPARDAEGADDAKWPPLPPLTMAMHPWHAPTPANVVDRKSEMKESRRAA